MPSGNMMGVTQVFIVPAFSSGTRFPNLNFVAVGDSITLGTGVATPWPTLLTNVLGSVPHNEAHSGAGWVTDPGGGSLTALAPTEVDPFASGGPILSLFAGRNDIALSGLSAAATYADFVTYLTARISAGWNVRNTIVATALPGTDLNETSRGDYNALLVSGAATYGYALVRLDQNSLIGLAGCQTNPTYYQVDQIHPTEAGAQIISDLYRAVIVAR